MLEGIIKVYQCCKPEHSYLIDLCKKLEKTINTFENDTLFLNTNTTHD